MDEKNIEDMQQKQEATTIFYDKLSTIAMTKKILFITAAPRHIDIRHHFIREHVTRGEIKMEHCSTEEQVVDLFTKSLPLEVLQIFALRESC